MTAAASMEAWRDCKDSVVSPRPPAAASGDAEGPGMRRGGSGGAALLRLGTSVSPLHHPFCSDQKMKFSSKFKIDQNKISFSITTFCFVNIEIYI